LHLNAWLALSFGAGKLILEKPSELADGCNNDMKQRKLLIAASVFFSTVTCAAILGMWVRSYSTCDTIWRIGSNNLLTTLGSNNGTLYFTCHRIPTIPGDSRFGPRDPGWGHSVGSVTNSKSFNWLISFAKGVDILIRAPYWCFIPLFAVAAYIPWINWRFSLRTMLIATMLIVVLLGMIAWAAR
jgi:hypothetical protein